MSNQYDQLFRYEPGKSKIATLLSSCEAVLGLIVMVVTCGFCIGAIAFAMIMSEWTRFNPKWPRGMLVGASILWLAAFPFALASIGRFGGTLGKRAEHPLVLSFALNRQPAEGNLRRLAYCTWWWLLGGLALAVCEGFQEKMRTAGGPAAAKIIQTMYEAAAYLGASIAGNGCLLIGMFHLTKSERFTKLTSRFRFAIDIILAISFPPIVREIYGWFPDS